MSKLQVDIDQAPNEIVMTRVFDAPRRLVLKAMYTPDLIKRWLGGARSTVVSAEVDLRVGGTYRYVFRPHKGPEFSFSGVFGEVSDDRIVHTEQFNDDPHGALAQITYTERGGKTTMRCVLTFESQEIRDMVLKTGMADGAAETYDQLDAVLASL